jgi:predicted ATPase/DNA-binding SARP family transcriptional activator
LSRLAIAILGPFLVTLDGEQLTGFDYDKVRALLAYLALEADRPHRREALAGLLWPEQPEKAARDGLRNALSTLRKAIDDEATDPPYLFITRTAIQFNSSSDHKLDTNSFIRALDLAAHHRHRNSAACRYCARWRREAAELYHGPLLAQFSLPDSPEFESWLLARREALHIEAMDAFSRLAVFYLRRGEYQVARYFAARQLAYEPWRESAYRQAMQALAQSGERSAALKQYETCRRILADELGVTPEPETTFLYERIRDGNLATKTTPRTVPAPLLPLIGRESDLATLGEKLADPDVRLVTITGSGGMGKTILAMAAGHQFGSDFGDGSVLVSLVTVEDPTGLFPAIASALGLSIEPSLDIEEQVVDYLRTRELLLILDNFEHLIEGANLLTNLMGTAPGVVLLVTSRQRLGLTTEWIYDLQGLAYPEEESIDPLGKYSAMQLFARRAQQERGDFALLSAEAIAAAEICRLVQGIPLAIELAAAAAGIQSTGEIARQLRAGLDTLSVEWADLPPRHRSIRAAFENSWAILSAGERRIMRRLSIFRGGFDAEAAGTVVGARPVDLRRLRHKSLLEVRDGERFGLHSLIRTFAAEQLVARDEAVEVAHTHLAYFTGMAEASGKALEGGEQLAWLRRLEADHANILAALAWAEETDVYEVARLASAMWLFWFMRGHLRESVRYYKHLYPRRDELPLGLRARLLNGYSSTLLGQGDFDSIDVVAREALACYREVEDDEGIGLAYHHLATAANWRGDWEASLALAEEGDVAAQRAVRTGTTWVLTIIQDTKSWTLTKIGRLAEAEELVRANISLSLDRNDRWAWAYHVLKLGILNLNAGDPDQARAEFEKTLAVAEEYGDRRLIASVSAYLGEVAVRRWNLAEAWRWAETAEQQYREVGARAARAGALETLGDILIRRGYPIEAALRYREARDVYAAVGDQQAVEKVARKLAACNERTA